MDSGLQQQFQSLHEQQVELVGGNKATTQGRRVDQATVSLDTEDLQHPRQPQQKNLKTPNSLAIFKVERSSKDINSNSGNKLLRTLGQTFNNTD